MMPVTRVKICGIATAQDAAAAVALGADALGFLVGLGHEAEDALSAKEAGALMATLPPYVAGTLVTHRSRPAEVLDLCRQAHPAVVQLQGDFPLDQIAGLRAQFPWMKILKTIHVVGETTVAAAMAAARYADAILLDTRTATRIGGTGLVHDWTVSRQVREALPAIPVILAGGLTPDNVARAIATVRPYAVDVNTGVSLRPARKSPELMARFVQAVRHP